MQTIQWDFDWGHSSQILTCVNLQAQEMQKAQPMHMRGPWHGFKILARSKLAIKLTITLMISGVVAEGM